MTNEIRGNLYKVVDNTRMPSNDTGTPQDRKNGPFVIGNIKPYITTPIRALRWFAYYALMWIRPFFQFMTRVIAIPAFIAGLFFLIVGDEERSHIPYLLFGTSFGSFLLGWFYDSLILRIAPEPIILT